MKNNLFKLEELEEKSLLKIFFKYFTLGLLFYFFNQAGSVVEMILEGGSGPKQVAALGRISFFIDLVFNFGMIIGVGGSVLITLKLAKDKIDEAERVLGNSITLLILFSLVAFVFAYLTKDILFSQLLSNRELINLANSYFVIRLMGIILVFLANYLIFFIVAEGRSLRALVIGLIKVLLRVAAIWIYTQLNLAVVHRALLLNLIDFVIVIFILKYFIREQTGILKVKLEDLKLKKVTLTILIIGFFPWLLSLSQNVFSIGLNILVSGTDISDNMALSLVNAYIYAPAFLLIYALTWLRPVIGYNYAKNNLLRLKELLVKLTLFFPITLVILLFLGEFMISSVCGLNQFDLIRGNFKYIMVIIPLISFKEVISIYLQATAQKLKLILIQVSNILLLITIPYFIWKFNFRIAFNEWLWVNTIVSVVMFVVALGFLIWELNSLKRK